MNRFLKRTARYVPRERYEPVPRHHRGADPDSEPRSFNLDRWVQKSTFELVVLLALIAGIGGLLIRHPYFSVTDIKITGLDTYANKIARDETTNYLAGTRALLPNSNYLVFSDSALENELKTKIAFDSLVVEKRFPHTIVITAAETPVKARVEAQNGQAFVSDQGTLVRWYPTTSTIDLAQSNPSIVLNKSFDNPHIGDVMIDPQIMAAVNAMQVAAGRISNEPLAAVTLSEEQPDRAELVFEQGMKVVVNISSDMHVQLEKAELSVRKYPAAKSIDVRFADKVFVSF